MVIFLDESGDLGFNPKSSGFFVITALVCESLIVAKKIRHAVKKVLQKMNHKIKKRKIEELKGSKTHIKIKNAFLVQMKKIVGWKLFSIVLNKWEYIAAVDGNFDKNRLYNELIKGLLREVSFDSVPKISLIVDKRQNKKDIEDSNAYLRRNLKSCISPCAILNITHEDSAKNYGLQAVDMFCYGIARKFEKDGEWYEKFRDFIYIERKFKVEKKTEPAM